MHQSSSSLHIVKTHQHLLSLLLNSASPLPSSNSAAVFKDKSNNQPRIDSTQRSSKSNGNLPYWRTSVASVFLHFKTVLILRIIMEAPLFNLSPILWNMTIPNGIPIAAYNMQNAFPAIVDGVECP